MQPISLKSARVNANLKQIDVANFLRVSKTTVISWEKGKTCPRIDQAQKLCKLYKLPMDAIFFLRQM